MAENEPSEKSVTSGIVPDEVVARARANDIQAWDEILQTLQGMLRGNAARFYIPGGTTEDLMQEAVVGVIKAVKDYDEKRFSGRFNYFADICVKRQIATAIRAATRQKHKALNEFVSIDKPVTHDDNSLSLSDIIADDPHSQSPEKLYLSEMENEKILQQIDISLSPLERYIVKKLIDGYSYSDIARMASTEEQFSDKHINVKSIDNGRQRAAKKLSRLFNFQV